MSLTVREVSVGMAVATVFLTYVCGLYVFDRKSALWAALIFTLTSPFLFTQAGQSRRAVSLLVQSVPPRIPPDTEPWIARRLRLVRFGGHARFCTKDQAHGLYVLPAVAVIVLTIVAPAAILRPRDSRDDGRPSGAVALVAIGPFVLCHNLRGMWRASPPT